MNKLILPTLTNFKKVANIQSFRSLHDHKLKLEFDMELKSKIALHVVWY